MLGFWLLASPFVFRFAETDGSSLANDLLCGLVILVFGFLSFWNRTGWAHFLILPVAAWLIIFGYLAGPPGAAVGAKSNYRRFVARNVRNHSEQDERNARSVEKVL